MVLSMVVRYLSVKREPIIEANTTKFYENPIGKTNRRDKVLE